MTTDRAPVLIDVRKYDGTLSARWTAERLGEDQHGVWLGTPKGTVGRSARGEWTSRFAYVVLVPRGQWWTATFCAAPGPELYGDVCTVPEWNPDRTAVHQTDLDLDVVRPRGGEAHVEDEEEFAEHRVRYGYPEHVVTEARRACAWLREAGRRHGAGAEPFASAYGPWLGLLDQAT
ncbi:DUF402 domain-containing protein [Streptomyces koyangensis]|uniref:DUF402 domain-containing protein n=1 Tax=Streptomyces koyangensis TaxID=188770 RepID=UPI0019336591|nr:DUF402 domain-containing protein [Streptomyces koyangensis]